MLALILISLLVIGITTIFFFNNQNKKYTTIEPHSIANYLSLNSWNKINNKNSYNSMETLIDHFKF
jgi:hypothetical protein